MEDIDRVQTSSHQRVEDTENKHRENEEDRRRDVETNDHEDFKVGSEVTLVFDLRNDVEIRGGGEDGDEPDENLNLDRPSCGRKRGDLKRMADRQVPFDGKCTRAEKSLFLPRPIAISPTLPDGQNRGVRRCFGEETSKFTTQLSPG